MRNVIAAVGVGFTGAVCAAEPVFVEYSGQGELGGFVSVDYTGFVPSLPSTGPIWAGHNKQMIDSQTVASFGLDLFRERGTGSHDVQESFVAFEQPTAEALNTLYNATGGRVESNAEAVAFQAVLWELITDFRGSASHVDLHSGALVFKTGVDQDLFDFYKSKAFGQIQLGDSGLRVLSRGGFQRQAIVLEASLVAVPLPSGAALALAGLGLVACRRRRA